jgi:DNA-directed RNA polymerase subunit RPC12/RpoP
MSGTGESYTCARCGGTFGKARSDEEAIAEARSTWTPETMADPQAVICDDCFREFIAWAEVNVPEALL